MNMIRHAGSVLSSLRPWHMNNKFANCNAVNMLWWWWWGGSDQLRPGPCKRKSYALFRTITHKISLFFFLVVNWLWKYGVRRTEYVFLAASYVKNHPIANAAINFMENFLELIYLASQWQKYKNINLPNKIGVGDEEEKIQNMTKENSRCNWVFLQKKPKKISDTLGAQLAGHRDMFTQQQRLMKLPTMWLIVALGYFLQMVAGIHQPVARILQMVARIHQTVARIHQLGTGIHEWWHSWMGSDTF